MVFDVDAPAACRSDTPPTAPSANGTEATVVSNFALSVAMNLSLQAKTSIF